MKVYLRVKTAMAMAMNRTLTRNYSPLCFVKDKIRQFLKVFQRKTKSYELKSG